MFEKLGLTVAVIAIFTNILKKWFSDEWIAVINGVITFISCFWLMLIVIARIWS